MAVCVPTISTWSLSGVPKFLPAEQIQRVLDYNRSTWTSDAGRFWPQLLTEDNGFNKTNIFVYGYDSPLLGESLRSAN